MSFFKFLISVPQILTLKFMFSFFLNLQCLFSAAYTHGCRFSTKVYVVSQDFETWGDQHIFKNALILMIFIEHQLHR